VAVPEVASAGEGVNREPRLMQPPRIKDQRSVQPKSMLTRKSGDGLGRILKKKGKRKPHVFGEVAELGLSLCRVSYGNVGTPGQRGLPELTLKSTAQD